MGPALQVLVLFLLVISAFMAAVFTVIGAVYQDPGFYIKALVSVVVFILFLWITRGIDNE